MSLGFIFIKFFTIKKFCFVPINYDIKSAHQSEMKSYQVHNKYKCLIKRYFYDPRKSSRIIFKSF